MISTVNVFEHYQQLETEGKLSSLVKAGVLSPSSYKFFKIKRDYNRFISRFKTKHTVVVEVCEVHNVCPATVYNALRFMEREVSKTI